MSQIFLTAYKIGNSKTAFSPPQVVAINPALIQKYESVETDDDSRFKSGTTKIVLGGEGYKFQVFGVYETVEQIQVAINPATTNPYAQDKELSIEATGGTQGAAFAMTKYLNEVDAGTATSADGIRLPTAVANKVVVVINNTALTLDVWPNTDDTVAGGAADAATTQPAFSRRHYVAVSDVAWILAE